MRGLSLGLKGAGHLSLALGIAFAMMLVLMPFGGALEVIRLSVTTPELRVHAAQQFGLLLGLSLCIWLLCVMSWHYGQGRLKQNRLKSVRVHAGTIMTETLIIMPVFLLLTFGLAQLSINMIGGILVNVAGWSATRAVWVWAPEAEAQRSGVNDAEVVDRARAAAAMVMTPVASGAYMSGGTLIGDLPRAGVDMRRAVLKGQVPLNVPDTAIRIASTGTANEMSIPTALGGDANFVLQSIQKFSRAYTCTAIEVVRDGENIGAKVTYKHYLGMPFIGPIMGGNRLLFWSVPELPNAANGYRPGYYLDYERQYMMPAQKVKPNKMPPDNQFFSNPPEFDSSSADGEITSNTGGF